MSDQSMRSLAEWRRTHGFGILNIVEPTGEYFFVETQVAETSAFSGPESWTAMSEPQLRQYLAGRGFSDVASEDTITLSRQWATTFTSPSFFPAPAAR